MAAIVPNDPYQCLMRKIGYSVGLEDLLKRVLDLTDLYVKQRSLSYASFQELVKNVYGTKSKKDEDVHHFAEFYQQLRLLQLEWQTIYPLYVLESLSILRRYLAGDDATFKDTAKIVLLQSVLEVDGDVFLNALTSDFEALHFKSMLECMLRRKRDAARTVFKSEPLLNRIFSIIDIQSQPTNRGGSRRNVEDASKRFEARSEPFEKLLARTEPLNDRLKDEIHISDDYLRKTPTTRKGWAEDFDLFKDGKKSDKGTGLLDALNEELKLKQDAGCYVFWPYSSELAKLRIAPKEMGIPDLTPWNLLCTLAFGLYKVKVKAHNPEEDNTELIELLRDFHRLYKEGDAGRGSIHFQLPLYIAQPCLVSLFAVRSMEIPPLPEIIDAEIRKKVRKIEKVVIRETEGGIAFTK